MTERKRACPACGKPEPSEQCVCGRPKGVQAAGERLLAYLHRLWAHDPEALATLDAAFTWMQDPRGGGCLHPLDAFMGMCREVLAGASLVEGHPLAYWQSIHGELKKRGACPCLDSLATLTPPAGLGASQ